MVVDTQAIETLKRDSATPAGTPTVADPKAPAAPSLTADACPTPGLAVETSSPLARILKLRVPLIAQLASRRLSLSRIRRLSIGTILEFERDVDEPLVLLANNRAIGLGTAVKIDEKFGLRIDEIRDPADRVRSLGAAGPSTES
jgi:flagellar motor switch protein FliN/FliY